ncbi:hypothetical protein UlMin_042041 [Ulmus minor]
MLLIYIRISFFLQISKLKLQAATAWMETTYLMLSIWLRLHSRHWLFSGKIVINGKPMDITLMQIVKITLQANPNNSVIEFKDNSSAIKGFLVKELRPVQPGSTCPLETEMRDLDILFTAETHNFPCAVAPYPGAETAGGPGYCVGNLNIEGSYAPWEDPYFTYPSNLASPLAIDSGLTRTFGIRLPNGERREWLKPIMFSGGIGQIDHIHITKGEPETGMLVVKIGGPAYRIGMEGGAASSINNPINSIHDQGAGGNCNVVKEIIYPEGAEIDIRQVVVGDHTMSEQYVIMVKPESRDLLQSICERERVFMVVTGTINGEGRAVLVDSLEKVLGDMPQKTFKFYWVNDAREALDIAPGITVMDALKRVDRCVTDLVAQQQTVGPLQITLADVAPLKGLLNPRSMAGLAIGEALTNLVWARVTSLSDVKASGNWMYEAKLDGEGAAVYDAAISLSDAMIKLGIAIDGGKDRLSMAAHSGGEVVKAPGNLVISVYCSCPDITKTVTPDLVSLLLNVAIPMVSP